jgi:hypothetical protein
VRKLGGRADIRPHGVMHGINIEYINSLDGHPAPASIPCSHHSSHTLSSPHIVVSSPIPDIAMDAKPAGADKTHEEVENAVTFAAGPQIEAADEISAVKETPVDLIKKINHGVVFTFEEEKAVLRKIDLRILPLILFAYFLQQLDKSSLSYASVFNIQRDAGLVGLQYSWLGSSLYLAQLVMQPLGAVLLVKYPTGKVISIAIFFWSVCLMGMVGCKNFGSLLAARVLLGSFESLIGELEIHA